MATAKKIINNLQKKLLLKAKTMWTKNIAKKKLPSCGEK